MTLDFLRFSHYYCFFPPSLGYAYEASSSCLRAFVSSCSIIKSVKSASSVFVMKGGKVRLLTWFNNFSVFASRLNYFTLFIYISQNIFLRKNSLFFIKIINRKNRLYYSYFWIKLFTLFSFLS